MVKTCCIPFCKSKSKNKSSSGFSFHEFPQDLTLCNSWLKVIARDGFQPNYNSATSLVCSIHFTELDYHQGIMIEPHYNSGRFVYKPNFFRNENPKTEEKRCTFNFSQLSFLHGTKSYNYEVKPRS